MIDNCGLLKTRYVAQGGIVERLAEDHAQEHQDHADDRGLAHAARADLVHPEARSAAPPGW